MAETSNGETAKKKKKGRFGNFFKANLPLAIIFVFLVLILIVFMWTRIFITIDSGQAAVLWRLLGDGTEIDITYGEGFHIISPLNKMVIYDIRNQILNDSITVLTSNGLDVHIDYSIRFQPEKEFLGLLHQQFGSDYIRITVVPEIRSAIRTVVGFYKPEDLYAAQKAIVEQIANNAIIRMSERYIRVDDVLIKTITLPKKISDAIQAKLEADQLAQEYEFRLISEKR